MRMVRLPEMTGGASPTEIFSMPQTGPFTD